MLYNDCVYAARIIFCCNNRKGATVMSGKVLIIDSDRNICELLRLCLEKEGYSVIVSNDGE